MKTKKVLLIVAFILAIAGVFFKIMHWPRIDTLLPISYLILFYLTTISLIVKGTVKKIQFLKYLIAFTAVILLTAFLLGLFHLPGKKIFVVASSTLLIIAALYLVFSNEKPEVSKETLALFFVFLISTDFHQGNGLKILFGSDHVKTKNIASLSPTKMNYVYLGCENPLHLNIPEDENKNITIKTDNGTITCGGNECNITPKDYNRLANVTIYSEGIEVGRNSFIVKLAPNPVVFFMGKQSGEISKKLLDDPEDLSPIMQDFKFDFPVTIKKFTVSAIIDHFSIDKVSYSAKFTQEQIDLIKKIQPRNKFYIEDIIGQGPDGIERKLGNIIIYVTE